MERVKRKFEPPPNLSVPPPLEKKQTKQPNISPKKLTEFPSERTLTHTWTQTTDTKNQ